MKKIKEIISKYIGRIEYVVTTLNVSGSVNIDRFNTIKDVDDFVISINNEPYWFVQKIEKIRKYNFKYNKNIIHTPLHFSMENVTETHNCNDYNYSFLKIDESLTNVTRKKNKYENVGN
jgi:hypothetical protein